MPAHLRLLALPLFLLSCAVSTPLALESYHAPQDVAQPVDRSQATNPVMAGADPHAMVIDGKVWMYPTHSGGGGPLFHAYSSIDLRTWQDHGPVLTFADVAWIGDDGQPTHYAWAPAVARRGRSYYFYYSVGPQGKTPARLGVAVGSSPAGPFKDSGKPLLTGGNGFEAIDPMVFFDPVSGKYFLYAGGSAGARLKVFELAPDMISFAREIRVDNPEHFTEGAFMHYYGGLYYLSYSSGGWRTSTYSSHYSTSTT
ncbi:MAG TPA: family 43 glycosylhydrolase, partial [Fimbriimonas sp.]|nr:family 43 glycosylhydrolase [Fimbriimonas sp.]